MLLYKSFRPVTGIQCSLIFKKTLKISKYVLNFKLYKAFMFTYHYIKFCSQIEKVNFGKM